MKDLKDQFTGINTIINAILIDYVANSYIRERLDASFQEDNKLFVLPDAHGNNITDENSYRRYFLQRLTKNYNIEIFMINQLMTQSNNMIKSEKYQQDKVMIMQLLVY